MAIITRWRMPPENWCGYSSKRDEALGMRTFSSRRIVSAARFGLGHVAMAGERLGNLPADGEDRIEAGHRLLEDHGDIIAAHLAHFLVRKREDVACR